MFEEKKSYLIATFTIILLPVFLRRIVKFARGTSFPHIRSQRSAPFAFPLLRAAIFVASQFTFQPKTQVLGMRHRAEASLVRVAVQV